MITAGKQFAVLCMLLCFTAVSAEKKGAYAADRTTSFYTTVGGAQIKDTYLSVIPYKGVNWGVGLDRFTVSRFGGHRWNTRHVLEGDMAYALSDRRNASLISYMFTYEFSFYRRYELECGLNLLAGGLSMLDAGAVYNPKNSNNPVSAKAALNFGLSGMASYRLYLKKYPVNITYSFSVPVIGVFFCPQFGASYYEMFSLGNREDWIHFGTFANYMTVINRLTLDFPVNRRSLRIGYEGKFRSMHENHLVYKYYTNTFILGITWDSSLAVASPRLKRKQAEANSIGENY